MAELNHSATVTVLCVWCSRSNAFASKPNHLNDFAVTVSSSMSLNGQSMYKGYERAFCVRMKSTLTKRGCHFKSSGYRVRLHTITAHGIIVHTLLIMVSPVSGWFLQFMSPRSGERFYRQVERA